MGRNPHSSSSFELNADARDRPLSPRKTNESEDELEASRDDEESDQRQKAEHVENDFHV